MKTRNTLLLLILAAGLFAYIRYYESRQYSTMVAREFDSRVVLFDPEWVDGITLVNNENSIEIRQRNGIWQVEAPVKDRADPAAVAKLLTAVLMLRKETTIEPHDDIAAREFDVMNSAIRLKFSGRGAPPEILFGKDAAVEGKMYVGVAGSRSVYAVSNTLKTLVTQKADDYRDHRLTDIAAAQVARLSIRTPSGEIELQRENDRWRLNKPVRARADDQKVSGLVAQILKTRIAAFVPEKEAGAASTGLAEPRGVITLYPEAGGPPFVLQIGQNAEKEKVYARCTPRDSVYLLPKNVVAPLQMQPNDLRDRHLLQLNLDLVDRIRIEAAGKPGVFLARQIEDWTVRDGNKERPANAGEVMRLASLLQTRQVAGFVADVASDLPKYGLDHPRLTLTFSSFASGNTAETTAGERPIAVLSFGGRDGGRVYARLEGEPFVVSVDESLFAEILTDPVQWRALTLFRLKPDEIVGIERTIGDGGTAGFVRGEKDGWKLAKGPGKIDEACVQSLCNTLATLRAVRWSGSGTDGLGFDKPAFVVSFKTADGRTARLAVGTSTPEGMWNARLDSDAGAFILSRPDVTAMQAELVLPPAAP